MGNEESEVWGWKGWYYYDVFGEGENKELESLWKWRIWEFGGKKRIGESLEIEIREMKNLRVWRERGDDIIGIFGERGNKELVFGNRNSRNKES